MPSKRTDPAMTSSMKLSQHKKHKSQPPTTMTVHKRQNFNVTSLQRRRKRRIPSPKPFRFLALPPEIRTQIYSYLVTCDRPALHRYFPWMRRFGLETAYTMHADDLRPRLHCTLFYAFPLPMPIVAHINRQTRAEAIAEYLRHGTFVVQFQAGAADLVNRVGRYRINAPFRRPLGKENEVCCYHARHGPECEALARDFRRSQGGLIDLTYLKIRLGEGRTRFVLRSTTRLAGSDAEVIRAMARKVEARKKEGEKLNERDVWAFISRFKEFVSFVQAEPLEIDYEDGFEI